MHVDKTKESKNIPFHQEDMFRYIAPFVVFSLFTALQPLVDAKTVFLVYALKTIFTAIAIAYLFRGRWKNEVVNSAETKQLSSPWLDPKALGLGVLVFLIWIGLGESGLSNLISDAEREIVFYPGVFESTLLAAVAIFFRVAGAVLLVPVMEELLWRSFLMRWLIKEQFLEVPIGTYTAKSFWITVAAFTAVHMIADWPAAIITGILYGAYVIRFKNIPGVIVAHAVTNLLLAIYVLSTAKYYYW